MDVLALKIGFSVKKGSNKALFGSFLFKTINNIYITKLLSWLNGGFKLTCLIVGCTQPEVKRGPLEFVCADFKIARIFDTTVIASVINECVEVCDNSLNSFSCIEDKIIC